MSHACHYCRHSGDSVSTFVKDEDRHPLGGYYDRTYPCNLGIDNSHMTVTYPTSKKEIALVRACPQGDPHVGFQIGGHYKYMHFEKCSEGPDSCLNWFIPEGVDRAAQTFHICDFAQLEEFVEFWREELENRGWIEPREYEIDRAPKKELKPLPIRDIMINKKS